MRLLKMRSLADADLFVLVCLAMQVHTVTLEKTGLKSTDSHHILSRKKIEFPAKIDYSETSEDHTVSRLETRRPLNDFITKRISLKPKKAIQTETANDGVKSGENGQKLAAENDNAPESLKSGDEQKNSSTQVPDSNQETNSQNPQRKTTAQAVGSWFSNKLKNARSHGNNENSGKRWFNLWSSPKSQTSSPTPKEDNPVAASAGDSSQGMGPSESRVLAAKEVNPVAASASDSVQEMGPSESRVLAAKKDNPVAASASDSVQEMGPSESRVLAAKEDAIPTKHVDNDSNGWFNGWSAKSQAPVPPAKDGTSAEKTPDDNSGRWFNGWSSKPPTSTPLSTTENLTAKRSDADSGGSWLGSLWSSAATPITFPAPEPSTSGFGGWFSGSPVNAAAADSKKEKKQHGRVRGFVKSVEHIVPKSIRRSIKSIPGVRPSHKAMKSTLDVVDCAVDSMVDSDYVNRIAEAGKKSGKRVGTKAVHFADSVLELGTGTSEATLNMASTLQKESARTLDSVGIAIPPAKPAVEYVNTKTADGVASLQEHNNRLRQGGKNVLSSISDYASLKEVDDKPAEVGKPDANSWFPW